MISHRQIIMQKEIDYLPFHVLIRIVRPPGHKQTKTCDENYIFGLHLLWDDFVDRRGGLPLLEYADHDRVLPGRYAECDGQLGMPTG